MNELLEVNIARSDPVSITPNVGIGSELFRIVSSCFRSVHLEFDEDLVSAERRISFRINKGNLLKDRKIPGADTPWNLSNSSSISALATASPYSIDICRLLLAI